MPRKMIDCREHPSEKNCSIVISGEEEEVVQAAVEHAISVHGESDTPEFRETIRASLKDEPQIGFSAHRTPPRPSLDPLSGDPANSFTG